MVARVVRRRGASLIEILAVIVVAATLAGWLLPRYLGSLRKSSAAQPAASPVQTSRAAACAAQLRQLALPLQQAEMTDEHPPEDLRAALRFGATEEMLRCPESGQPYRFDPETRTLSCQTPGHQDSAVKVGGS